MTDDTRPDSDPGDGLLRLGRGSHSWRALGLRAIAQSAAHKRDKVFMINSTGSVTIGMFYLQFRSKKTVIS